MLAITTSLVVPLKARSITDYANQLQRYRYLVVEFTVVITKPVFCGVEQRGVRTVWVIRNNPLITCNAFSVGDHSRWYTRIEKGDADRMR